MIQDMNINISHAFYYSSGSYTCENAFYDRIKSAFDKVTVYSDTGDFKEPYIKDMQTVSRFLHGGGQTYKVDRIFVDGIGPDVAKTELKNFCAMFSFFEESNIIAISFHYHLSGISSDKVIALRQSGVYTEYDFNDGKYSFNELAERIRKKLGLSEKVETSYLTEVTKFGDYTSLDEIEKDRSKLLYGLLTGDEGYRFVPQELIDERLTLSWGSRDFIRIYACKQSFLFINLLDSPSQKAYLERQDQFGGDIYGGCDSYFKMRDCSLTVNHGILFSVEFVMILKALINEILSFQSERKRKRSGSYYKRIRETREFRRKIINVLEKVEQTQIAEIGELSAVLLKSQHVAPIVEEVKYLLELLEGDLSLIYSERNNLLVTILTILGLLLAVWQVILAL